MSQGAPFRALSPSNFQDYYDYNRAPSPFSPVPGVPSSGAWRSVSPIPAGGSTGASLKPTQLPPQTRWSWTPPTSTNQASVNLSEPLPINPTPLMTSSLVHPVDYEILNLNFMETKSTKSSKVSSTSERLSVSTPNVNMSVNLQSHPTNGNGFLSGFERQTGYELVDSRDTSSSNFQSFNVDLQPCFDAEFVYPPGMGPNAPKSTTSVATNSTSKRSKSESRVTQKKQQFQSYQQQFQSPSLNQTQYEQEQQRVTTTTVRQTPLSYEVFGGQAQQGQHIQFSSYQGQSSSAAEAQLQYLPSQYEQVVQTVWYDNSAERTAEYQSAIYHLQDERERVQMKTFAKWINSYLKKHGSKIQIENLLYDLTDGVTLLTLIQLLSGQKLPVERGRRRHHFLCNHNTLLEFLKANKIKLVNINACDLVDGRPTVILGLIWTIILYFQIKGSLEESPPTPPHQPEQSAAPPPEKKQVEPKQDSLRCALLEWVRNLFAQNKVTQQVNDFGKSWRDGFAFLYLVNCLKAGLLDVEGLHFAPTQARLSNVFKVAEEGLGIMKLLDAEDVDVPKPDEKSVMTYVAQFLHWYNNRPPEEPEPPKKVEPPPPPPPPPPREPTPPPPPPQKDPSDDLLAEFEAQCKIAEEYLQRSEVTIKSLPKLFVGLSEKKNAVVRFQSELQELFDWQQNLEHLNAKAQKLLELRGSDSRVSSLVVHLTTIFNQLLNLTKEINATLETHHMEHENYWQRFQETLEFLRKLRLGLEQYSDCQGDRPEITAKLEMLSEIEAGLKMGDELVNMTIEEGEATLKSTADEGQGAIRDQMTQIQRELQDLKGIAEERQRKLRSCLESWDMFEASYTKVDKNINEMETVLGQNFQQALDRCKKIMADIAGLKPEVDELGDQADNLTQICQCPQVKDLAEAMKSRYSNLVMGVQEMCTRIEKRLNNQMTFSQEVNEFDQWLQKKEDVIQQCNGEPPNEDVIRDRLKLLKCLLLEIPQGQRLLYAVKDSMAAMEDIPIDQRDHLSDLERRWEILNDDLKNTISDLEEGLLSWQRFRQNCDIFSKWCHVTMETLSKMQPNGDLKQMLDTLKNIGRDIQSKKADLQGLSDESQKLTSSSHPSPEVEELINLWNHVDGLVVQLSDQLEKEAKEQSDYKTCLQEVEMWLLHTSTQLTATNSLRITNIDQARDQLNFHKTLMSEIENYRNNLDNLSGKGYRLVEIYIASDPDIEAVIAKQLKTVEDSYQQLYDTAREINMRLENSVREFQKYLDTLENIFQNLQQMDQDINVIAGSPAQNFEALAERHNSFSGMHNKLQGEKIRLNLAVQSCQAATASVSRPSSPMDEEVPIPEMELQVRALIEDLIDRVQNEQGRCSSAHADMESVKAVKDNINGWLSEMAGKLRDIEGRPVPLCENTAKIERGQLETIKNGVHEKLGKLQEIELQEKGLIQGGYLPDLQTKLQKLDGDSDSIIGSRGSFHDHISEFQNLLKNANGWIEGLSGKVEPLRKKGAGISGAQKAEQLRGILDEFLEGHPKILQEVHSAAEKFMGALSTPDGEQVQEQIKGLRKRFQDFRVSLEKEGQNLEESQKGFKDFLNDLLSFWEGGKRIKESLGTSKIGYAVPPAETMLSATQAKLQDFEGQKGEFLKFEQRLPSLRGELEAIEIQEAKDKLKEIQGCHDDLINDLRGYVDHLRNGIVLRKKFMERVSFLRSFISGVTQECDSRTLPLLSGDVQGKLEKMKEIAESKIPEFQKTHLPEVRKEASSLEQDCDPEQLTRLKQLIADLSLDHLLEKLRNYETRLLEALKERKSFEGYYSQCHNSILGMEKCIQNLEDSTATTTNEFGEPQYADKKALEDKLTKFHLLLEDSQRINEDIQSLIEKGTEMVPSLNEPDQQSLKDKLKSLTSDLQNLKSSLEDKLDGTRDEIKNEEHVTKITAETKEYLGKLKDEVSALKKPVGFGIEDSAALLSAYEKLLADLKAYRQKLEDTPLKGLKSNAELQRLLCEQDTLAGQIEAEIEKLRRLLLIQQQFLQLVTEITNFIVRYTDVVKEIEKSGTSPLEKAKRYEDAILRIQDCEGLLATAMEQGEIIAKEDTVAEEDRKAIMEQLHSLKAQVEGLRKTVEDQRNRHLETCQKHAKNLDDLTKTIQWLQEKDATIKGKPLLERPSKSVEVELRRHDDFARDVKLRLNEIESILDALKYDDGLPSLLTDKMVEGRSLLERIPGELQSRHRYLLENKDIRQTHELEVDGIWGWVSEVKSKLGDKDQFGVNFDTLEQDLEIHNKSFGVSAKRSLQDQLNSVKDGVNRIWSSLIPYEQESLSKDQENLNEAVQNIFNSAKNIQAKLEQGRSLYKTFLDLINSVNACISKSRIQEAPVSTVVALRRNLGIVQDTQKQLQKEKVELDGLGEWAQSAQKVANDQSKEKLQTMMNEIYKNWNESLTGLESRKNILTKLAGQWEQCEALCQSFESGLSSVEANFSQVDLSTRSRQQVDEAKNKLAGVLGEVKKLEGTHREMLNTLTLFEASSDSTLGLGALKSKVELLSKQYSNVMQMLEEKLEWLTNQLQYLDELEKKMEEFQKFLVECDDEIQSLDPFDKSHDSIDTKIIAVDKKLKNTSDEINGFSAKVKDRFSSLAQILPTSISKSVSNLQLELDKTFSNLDDKRKSVKNSRALVSEFERDVDSLEKWMRGAEDQLQKNLRSEPTQQKRILQNLFSELPGALYQLERSRKSGGIIAEKTKCPQEGRKVKDIVENIESELNRLKAALEERKLKIDEVVDFWQRFFELHALVVVWIQEQNNLLKEPIRLSSLEKTKQTLNIYVTAVKSLKGVGKQLSDMGKEADHVAEITSAAPLYEKLAAADQAKTDIEGQLLERSSLLQETVEEWEQFEKKLKESDAWLKKARQSIEAGKKKPAKEKLLAGVGVQRTKIGMALGKLQVHFNACIGGDPNVEKEQKEIDRALEQFANEVTLSQSTPEPPTESSTN